jgi:hypothetical protein
VERHASINQDASLSLEHYRLGVDHLAIKPQLKLKIREGLAEIHAQLIDQCKALGFGLFPLPQETTEQHEIYAPSVGAIAAFQNVSRWLGLDELPDRDGERSEKLSLDAKS